ncbi:unnamed protein product [Cylindrotheca closterium]|uniref:Uncharacterized protein n=1 Tax=Cylindrotheca closterium TaxID=2856 RepID=A0AAD2PWB6_9STRA|nr:unnamed protein product [Cylindrotheca closterium]
MWILELRVSGHETKQKKSKWFTVGSAWEEEGTFFILLQYGQSALPSNNNTWVGGKNVERMTSRGNFLDSFMSAVDDLTLLF